MQVTAATMLKIVGREATATEEDGQDPDAEA